MMLWSCLIFLGMFISTSQAARILAIMPMPTQSHANLMDPLVQELGLRGHQVTYFSAMHMDLPGVNISYRHLPIVHDWSLDQRELYNTFAIKRFTSVLHLMMTAFMPAMMCRRILQEPSIQELIASQEKYDLVISEAMASDSLLAGFSHKFQAPFIALSTTHTGVWANYMSGNPSPTAIVPEPMLPFTNKMSLLQRILNTVYVTLMELMHSMVNLWVQDGLMREFFGSNLPHLRDIIKNVSLVLVNQHYSLSFPRPYNPNVVEIGGFHLQPTYELPPDLKKYIEESEHGVILFSLGSHIRGSQMTKTKIDALVGAFSQLKENILWKFDGHIEKLPNNIKVFNWLPQSNILAHPNLKLFITHGGLLSTTEAVYRGVPLVGIPGMFDQPANMQLVENFGYGKTIQYEDITEEFVLETINEVMYNPRYKETAKLRSQLLKDTPMPPMETAMYWIEYVLRHKGAPHLRSAAQDLAWYQLYLLDVYAVLAIFTAVSLTLQFYIARYMYRNLRSVNQSKSRKIRLQIGLPQELLQIYDYFKILKFRALKVLGVSSVKFD